MFRARSQQGMAMRHPLLRLRVLSLGAGGAIHDAGSFGRTRHRRADARLRHLRRYRLGTGIGLRALRWLMSPNVLPFPVHIVSAGNILDSLLDASRGER